MVFQFHLVIAIGLKSLSMDLIKLADNGLPNSQLVFWLIISNNQVLTIHYSLREQVNLLAYVDDIILAGKNMKTIDEVKAHLQASFKIKYLGELKTY